MGGESAQSLVGRVGFTSLTSKGQQKAVSILESQNDRANKMNFLLKPGSYEEPNLLEQLFMRRPFLGPPPSRNQNLMFEEMTEGVVTPCWL